MVFLRRVLALACALAAPLAYTAEINKCVDNKGNVTYTDATCGSGHTLEQRFEPVNPKPGGNDTVRMAPATPAAIYTQAEQAPTPPAAPRPAPVQVVPAPPVPQSEPNVVYVPTSSESRYIRPYARSTYDERRSYSGYGTRYGNGYGSNRDYDRRRDRHDNRPPPSRPPEKPRPTWRGENDATRVLIQGGGSRGSDRGPGREWRNRN